MINWEEVEAGRKSLTSLGSVKLVLTPLEFVVLNEVLREYVEVNPSDERTRVMINELTFEFSSKGE